MSEAADHIIRSIGIEYRAADAGHQSLAAIPCRSQRCGCDSKPLAMCVQGLIGPVSHPGLPSTQRIASSAYCRNSSALDMTLSRLSGMPCERHLHQPSVACAGRAVGVWSKWLTVDKINTASRRT
jgi:hypothetical protein